MPSYIYTVLLLVCSNTFMTFAWYAHLNNLNHKALWMAILLSWSIALFEYIFQVPANRIGFNNADLSLAQLKILQEVITLSIFMPFAIFYMHQNLSWNFIGASICMVGAVYFMFR